MRVQLASDLHYEFLQRRFPEARLLEPAPDADVLVLAGDIGVGPGALDLFRDWPVPVVYVMGNHEAYGRGLDATAREVRTACRARGLHFLERDAFVHDGVRFLGTTLWTDFEIGVDGGIARDAAMTRVGEVLIDHREIADFPPSAALAAHRASRAWLERALAAPFDGPTVVVTHHGVHAGSIHPRWAGDPVNAGFVSDLSALLPSAPLWLHGHVHDSFDYRVAGARVVANPRGYPQNLNAARTADELVFENAAFIQECVVAV